MAPFPMTSSEDSIAEQIARGVDAICVCGTTGESATMSAREHDEAITFCVRQAKGRVKVIAGAGSNDTAAALSLSQRAQEAGADALLHVTPYYNKATQAGLIRHYEYIADRVDLPILLYHVPGRTGVSFTAETYASSPSTPISTASRRPAEISPWRPAPSASAATLCSSGPATTIKRSP